MRVTTAVPLSHSAIELCAGDRDCAVNLPLDALSLFLSMLHSACQVATCKSPCIVAARKVHFAIGAGVGYRSSTWRRMSTESARCLRWYVVRRMGQNTDQPWCSSLITVSTSATPLPSCTASPSARTPHATLPFPLSPCHWKKRRTVIRTFTNCHLLMLAWCCR